MSMLDIIVSEISIEVGYKDIPIHQILKLGRGSVISIDTPYNDGVVLKSDNVAIASGRIVIEDEAIGIEIEEILKRAHDFRPRHFIEAMDELSADILSGSPDISEIEEC